MSTSILVQGACASRRGDPARAARFAAPRLFLLTGALILALTCAYAIYAWSLAFSRNVWIVNGLDRGYDVRIDGKVHHLMAHEARQIPLSEGEVRIASADPATPFPEQICRVTTPLFSRPFTKPLFVLNPDRTALVYEEDALFTSEMPKSLDEMGHHRLFVGQTLSEFANVDYPFIDFPEAVSGADGSASVLKKKVALWTIGSPVQQTRVIEKELGHDAVTVFAEHLALCNPENQSALMLMATVMPREQVIDFLRTRLDVRPVQVVWHRTYQQLVQQVDPQFDLVGEYRARLSAQPQDASLMYLLARVVPDRAESAQWLGKSTACAYPSGYGFFALGYRALSRGDFETALLMGQEAANLLPDNLDAKAIETESLAALGHYDRLLTRAREEQAKNPLDPRPVLQEIQLLAIQGDSAQARRVSQAFVARATGPGRGEIVHRFERNSAAMIEYAGGNLAQFLATLGQSAVTVDEHFEYDLSLGRLDDAAVDLSNIFAVRAGQHLTLAIAALDAGRDDLASRHLQLAALGYAKGDNDMRRVAGWLAQLEPPDPDEVCDVALMPDQKRLVLTALGLKDAAHRDRYFKAAAALNYDRAFPYLTVKRVLDGSLVALK